MCPGNALGCSVLAPAPPACSAKAKLHALVPVAPTRATCSTKSGDAYSVVGA
uniref:Uncharacterized protein n=1 Tax=Arundo donax TaxID=35708 RepID=A0A0A9AQ31_ARUDO